MLSRATLKARSRAERCRCCTRRCRSHRDAVRAGAAIERVCARPTEQPVVTGAAEKRVVAAPAVQAVVPVAAVEHVCARTAGQTVIARTAEQLVVTRHPVQAVVAAAVDSICARAALHDVVALAGADEVVAAKTADHVVTAEADDDVGPRGAVQDVGAVGADDRRRRAKAGRCSGERPVERGTAVEVVVRRADLPGRTVDVGERPLGDLVHVEASPDRLRAGPGLDDDGAARACDEASAAVRDAVLGARPVRRDHVDLVLRRARARELAPQRSLLGVGAGHQKSAADRERGCGSPRGRGSRTRSSARPDRGRWRRRATGRRASKTSFSCGARCVFRCLPTSPSGPTRTSVS